MRSIVFGPLIALSLLVISGQTQEAITTQSIFDNIEISISLSNYQENEAFTKRITLAPASIYTINITNVSPIVSFLIFQVHTYQYNITLSYEKLNLNRVSNTNLFGSNVGLYTVPKNESTFFIKNDNVRNVEALLAVVPYFKQAPVPGGCNMEFNNEVAPYQKLLVNDPVVAVDLQRASLSLKSNETKTSCNRRAIYPETYRFYLTEQDYSVESYFSAITSMLTVNDILRNGEKVPPPSTFFSLRRYYSLYFGVGTVYAAIATDGNDSSAYVPTFTYGFNYILYPEDGHLLNDTFPKVFCILTLLIGFFCTFLRNNNVEFVTYTAYLGGMISYSIVKYLGYYDLTKTIGISIGGSVVFLILIGLISLCFKMNLTIFFSTLSLGFLCTSIAYFSVKDSLEILEDYWTFLSIYLSVASIVIIILIVIPRFVLTLTCGVLGGFMVVLPIAYFANSILVYIIINVIRRLTVPVFSYAIVSHPLQTKDIGLIVLWILLAIVRISKEYCRNVSCFDSQRTNFCGLISVNMEQVPLVGNALYKARVLVYVRPRAR